VKELECVRLDQQTKPIPGTEFRLPAELVLLAMGFLHPMQEGMVKELKLDLDARGNVKANDLDYRTSRPTVFAAGDMRRGQSLVVWAIREGRQAAHAIDKFLLGKTDLSLGPRCNQKNGPLAGLAGAAIVQNVAASQSPSMAKVPGPNKGEILDEAKHKRRR
jgi:NADH dehydrogenase FAD-containing subunit